jgi:hypothetical protein
MVVAASERRAGWNRMESWKALEFLVVLLVLHAVTKMVAAESKWATAAGSAITFALAASTWATEGAHSAQQHAATMKAASAGHDKSDAGEEQS